MFINGTAPKSPFRVTFKYRHNDINCKTMELTIQIADENVDALLNLLIQGRKVVWNPATGYQLTPGWLDDIIQNLETQIENNRAES